MIGGWSAGCSMVGLAETVGVLVCYLRRQIVDIHDSGLLIALSLFSVLGWIRISHYSITAQCHCSIMTQYHTTASEHNITLQHHATASQHNITLQHHNTISHYNITAQYHTTASQHNITLRHHCTISHYNSTMSHYSVTAQYHSTAS